MRALVVLALTLRLVSPSLADAPSYSSDTIVNGASYQPGALAPNTIAILYGQNLSMGTAAFTADNSGFLPLMLPGTGAQLSVGSLPACAVYVSPTQITFLVPPNLPAGTFDLRL